MRVSLALVGALVLLACNFSAVQGSAGAGTGTGTDTDTDTTSGTQATTTASGQTCFPGASVECACNDGSVGAQVCNPDGKSLSPCTCEGSSDSEGGTTTAAATTTGPDPTSSSTTAPATGPDTTTGSGCVDPGPEPNEVETEAVDLGDQGCEADAKMFMGLLDGNADVDWFTYHGVYVDCGILPPDPTAAQTLTAGATVRMCVFAECDDGPVEFACDGDASMSLSPGGRPGCCNQGDVSFDVNCTDSDENARIYVRVDQGPADACVDYSVTYSYLVE